MQKKQKNTGGSPKFAIPYDVAEIALKYGKTVSKGIQGMKEKINESEAFCKGLGFNEEWK